MALKKLKEYGLQFKQVQDISTALNKTELADNIKVVGVGGDVLLKAFLDAIDSIAKKKMKEVPDNIVDFYEALPQAVFDDDDGTAPAKDATTDKKKPSKKKSKKKVSEKPPEPEDEVTSACPTFKTGFDPNEEDCQECETEFPKEYAACVKACNALAEKKAAKKSKKKAQVKTASKRTRYGHMAGTMTGLIDDMLWEGNTRADIIKKVAKQFERTDQKAGACLTGHLKRMVRLKVVILEERTDDVLKAENEYSEGFNKDNTQPAI